MGLVFKSVVHAIGAAFLFYILLLAGSGFGLRAVAAGSFDYISGIITILNFTFSILNIRIK